MAMNTGEHSTLSPHRFALILAFKERSSPEQRADDLRLHSDIELTRRLAQISLRT